MDNGKEITGEMTIGKILRVNPRAVEVLLEMGMHCIGCPSAQGETIAEAAAAHEVPLDEILAKLNSL